MLNRCYEVGSAADLYDPKGPQSSARYYLHCVLGTSGEDADLQGCFEGRVPDYLMCHLPSAAYGFYWCGRQDTIGEVMPRGNHRFPGSLVYYKVL
jgi:hypothetical protein